MFDPLFRDVNVNSKSFNEFHESYSDSLDILIIGSSHAKNTYNSSILDSVFQTRTYNLGSAGQNYLFTNLLLEDILNKTKPKLVIVDIFPAVIRVPTAKKGKGNQLRIVDYTSFGKNRFNLINKVYSTHEMPSVYSETIRNHDKWFDRNWNDSNFDVGNKNFFFRQGYFNSNKTLKKEDYERYKFYAKEHDKFLKVKPSKKDRNQFIAISELLENTIKICRENSVNVIFVSSPYFDSFYKDKFNNIHYLLHEFFESKKDIDFIDFNKDFNNLGLTLDDFWDKGHLNIVGSKKVSLTLAKYLDQKSHFKVKNQKYFSKNLEKIPQRKNTELIELDYEVNKSIIDEVINTGVSYDLEHSFKNIMFIENATFYIDENNRYVVLEYKSSYEEDLLDDYYFFMIGTILKSDFNKRPEWNLGTNKDKLFWETTPEIIQTDNKNYFILKLDRKCSIDQFKTFQIALKSKINKKSLGAQIILNNIKLKN
ncbi:hypothetical protein [Winogradskyella sp.]|uniref:hypothetical protein n=1 Tax=Winogradskyella sp. TaxID=1883156 RepID=UPI003F6CCB6C